MKALVKYAPAPGAAAIREVPVPRPGPGEVLVKVEATAICGTDIHVMEWSPWAQSAGVPIPTVMGHEFAGRVVEVGDGVEYPRVGAFVAGETHIPCGRCFQCRTGLQHICNKNAATAAAVRAGSDRSGASYHSQVSPRRD